MVVKLDYAGNVIWKKVYRFNVANPNYYPSSEPTKIIPMTDGGFVVVGFTNSILQNGSHILVFRVSSTGLLMWSANYGTTAAFHWGNSIVLDGSDLVVTGYRRTGANAQDAIMMKIPAAGGAPLWTRVWDPQANTETGYDIIRSNQSTASFGYAVTGDVSLNSQDAFIWRTNANGLLDSSTCNNSVTLLRTINNIRLDSFYLVRNAKYCKDFTPVIINAGYRHNTICLGTFATLPDEEVNNDNPVEVVDSYGLSQNYPNPFNPATTIKFQIPVEGNVSVKVYDISGKLVTELVNEFMQTGKHSVQFNGSNLSSGAYYYRIDANGFTDIKKMLLIK
ncbi:MAG: T9SS type A sorting domain-containing protein [Ignavibacteria bacterium]|nr:T9SS type A sorting domain-containing protein [Ignavibacteria bacterium]